MLLATPEDVNTRGPAPSVVLETPCTSTCLCARSHMCMLARVQVPHDITHQPCASSCLQRDCGEVTPRPNAPARIRRWRVIRFFSSAMDVGVACRPAVQTGGGGAHPPHSWEKSTGFPVGGGRIQPRNQHVPVQILPGAASRSRNPPFLWRFKLKFNQRQVQGWLCGPSELIPPLLPSRFWNIGPGRRRTLDVWFRRYQM